MSTEDLSPHEQCEFFQPEIKPFLSKWKQLTAKGSLPPLKLRKHFSDKKGIFHLTGTANGFHETRWDNELLHPFLNECMMAQSESPVKVVWLEFSAIYDDDKFTRLDIKIRLI